MIVAFDDHMADVCFESAGVLIGSRLFTMFSILKVEVEEGDKQGFAGVISPRKVGGNGGKDVSCFYAEGEVYGFG
jgi:hypothetical protein